MIYITYKYDFFTEETTVRNIWEVNCDNAEEKYIDFMKEKAKQINVVINPYWLNIMSRNNNPQLNEDEYEKKKEQWRGIQTEWSFEKYLSKKLKGVKKDSKSAYRFQ